MIDALRPDALGCYGASRPTSPHLDALAARSLVFDQAFSTAPWTLPSMGSLFTGTYPSVHGQLRHAGAKSKLSDDLTTLAEALRDGGYDTVAFSTHPWVSPAFGLGQGFAPDGFHLMAAPDKSPELDTGITEAALAWLEARPSTSGRPFFAYFHYMGPHNPYAPSAEMQRAVLGEVPHPPTFSARLAKEPLPRYFDFLNAGAQRGEVTPEDVRYLRALYDAEVRTVDAQVGRLLQALGEGGRDRRTVVVVTADHGEAFLEHGEMLHGRALHVEMLRIPLIVRLPDAAARRVPHRVQNVDVMPTLLEAVGLAVPEQVQGRSRLPGRDPGPVPAFAEADFHDRYVKIMSGRFTYLADLDRLRAGRLYDLETDPLEKEDLRERYPEEARLRRQAIKLFRTENDRRRAGLRQTAPAVDEATREALRALGYAQ